MYGETKIIFKQEEMMLYHPSYHMPLKVLEWKRNKDKSGKEYYTFILRSSFDFELKVRSDAVCLR